MATEWQQGGNRVAVQELWFKAGILSSSRSFPGEIRRGNHFAENALINAATPPTCARQMNTGKSNGWPCRGWRENGKSHFTMVGRAA
jgi:hypothetical protein